MYKEDYLMILDWYVLIYVMLWIQNDLFRIQFHILIFLVPYPDPCGSGSNPWTRVKTEVYLYPVSNLYS